jgi:hypothetical protein
MIAVPPLRLLCLALALAAVAALAGCGGSSHHAVPSTKGTTVTPPPPPPPPQPARTTTSASPSALQAEATSAATGDIPDNQVFLTFRDRAAGWSMEYPEGWAQSGSGSRLAFRDKNNIVRVVVAKSATQTTGSVRKQLHALEGAHVQSGPTRINVSGAPAIKVVYTTRSAPNQVTGKSVTLAVDRYYVSHAGKEAIVDLGTPQGVDNVDAYRRMIESFRWR